MQLPIGFIAASQPDLSLHIRLLLSAMNFLEYAIWGSWFVVLGQYLNRLRFTRNQIGSIYATMSLGLFVAPIFVGTVADKYFASEYIMSILHLVGAGLLLLMAQIRTPGKFYVVSLLYALLYAPTLPLSNGIVFNSIPDPQRDFPSIRVLGTVGWIAANLFGKVLHKPGQPITNKPLLLAAILSATLGIFSLFLPHVPPSQATNALPSLSVPALLCEQSLAVFIVISFLVSLFLAFYYSFASLFLEQQVGVRSDLVAPLMTIGQLMEIFFLLALPWFLEKIGMRWVLICGMAAWSIRYGLFALGRPFPFIIVGLALHGICFDFLFVAGAIYVNDIAPKASSNSAQSLFAALTFGLGMFIGTETSGWLNRWYTKTLLDVNTQQTVTVTNWVGYWFVPCVGVAICVVAFFLLSTPK